MAPKYIGMLGIGSLKASNLALLAKWWQMYKKETSSLWVNVINAIRISPRVWKFLLVRFEISDVWKKLQKLTLIFLELTST